MHQLIISPLLEPVCCKPGWKDHSTQSNRSSWEARPGPPLCSRYAKGGRSKSALSRPQRQRSPQTRRKGFPLSRAWSVLPAPSQVFTMCPARLSTGGTQRWNTHLKESHPAHIPFLLLFLAILPQQEKMTRLCHYSN